MRSSQAILYASCFDHVFSYVHAHNIAFPCGTCVGHTWPYIWHTPKLFGTVHIQTHIYMCTWVYMIIIYIYFIPDCLMFLVAAWRTRWRKSTRRLQNAELIAELLATLAMHLRTCTMAIVLLPNILFRMSLSK